MQLSWGEIRARAADFAREWEGVADERAEAQSFWNDFFHVFGQKRRARAVFEKGVKLDKGRGRIDLFWPGKLIVEHKSGGRDLFRAGEQLSEYLLGLPDDDLPRYSVVCDFRVMRLEDRDTGEATVFPLRDLPRHVGKFGFMVGIERRFRDQDPVNVRAAELMGALHDSLKATGYAGHDLERLLVRLMFCLFAEDTFALHEQPDAFSDLIRDHTRPDGSDVGPLLIELFQVLDTPLDKRSSRLREELRGFEYINGRLFGERLSIPQFDADMRAQLLTLGDKNWDQISPAIFGALFQSVMKPAERRRRGAHYTTEKNILKVIGPLFLDGFRAEFERLRARAGPGRRSALIELRGRVQRVTLLDPACGCGNFLVIAYRELRLLDMELLREIHPPGDARFAIPASRFTELNVDNFYGIEIEEFSALIAEVAMWMMDHIMNLRLAEAYGVPFARFPLEKSATIVHGDALELDWADVLPPERCTHVLGNPPFVGAKMQSEAQRAQVRRIAALGGSGGTLDYVAAWFLKAAAYVQRGNAAIGFVATNSITQGEQVAQLWPGLFDRYGLEIAWAHRTFAWGSDARGVAHVHVVLIGLTRCDPEPAEKRLFSYATPKGEPTETRHGALSAYLTGADALANRHLVVAEANRPLDGSPPMIIGSKPIDGGYLILDQRELTALRVSPGGDAVAPFVRPFIGATEYIDGTPRWIVAVQDAPPELVRDCPFVVDRIRQVRRYRLGEIAAKGKTATSHDRKPGISSSALAATPSAFHVTVLPTTPFLVIPEVSSERRDYVPIGWLEPPVIPSNKIRILADATTWHFGVLTSRMHMAWLATIGGRLESRFQYSIGVVYNTFPWPRATAGQRARVEALAQGMLDARAHHPTCALGTLYDPDLMPPDLRTAHAKLDTAVDRLYRAPAFRSDRERAEHLLGLYEQMVAALPLGPAPAPRRRRRAPLARPRPNA